MAILFLLENDEQLIARVDADCCSHTWIEHIELPTEFPCEVISGDSLRLNQDCDDRDGELSFYGYKLTTTKGDIVIDYRNESNGYYGGSILFGDEPERFYGGVYGQNISKLEWVEIEHD